MLDFESVFTTVTRHIESKYKVEVQIGEVHGKNTGDLNGKRIVVAERLDWENRLFVLGHVFGHTVQWDSSDELRLFGQEMITKPSPEQLRQVFDYEYEATAYFVQLLHEVGVMYLDQWASDFWFADWEALKAFYVAGVIIDQDKVRDTIVKGSAKLIQGKPIPPFTPKEFESRWSFG